MSFTIPERGGKSEAKERPLCRNYQFVLLQALCTPSHENGRGANRQLAWALGVALDGAHECLGVWEDEGNDAEIRDAIWADLRRRGVERVRYALSPGDFEAAPASVGQAVLASQRVAEELRRLSSRAVTRHGPFANAADAISFVADALHHAEDRLGVASVKQAAQQLAGQGWRRVPEPSGATSSLAH